jgi:hypothetical protein
MTPIRVKVSHKRSRRAAVLIAALVCLAIVMALVGAMLLAALRTGRQLHVERDLRQCELLLSAGIARATSQIAQARDYRGETWRLSSDEITGAAAGEVKIEAVPDSPTSDAQLRITAEYPLGNETSIRRSKTIHVSNKNRQ